jgi:4-hydroxybenzoate polyprenyltransferase
MKAYYRVCRLEYAPGEIPAMLTVLFLGSMTISRFFDFIVIEALFAFILLYLSGFIINAITDKEIDKQYDTFKTSIPKSVELLGEKTLWGLIGGHVIVSIILALHISLQMGSFIPLALVIVGVFFGLGYSVKPFQFKVKGIWHAIALGSSAFLLPFLFLMFVVAEGIPANLFVFILGFSFVHYGMEFGNQAIDYIEDKASNVRTPPVRWGMKKSLRIALGCVLIGILTEGYALYYILLSRGSFAYISPILATYVVYGILMSIILIGYYIPTKGLWDMLAALHEKETVEESMPQLKKICNYAQWQTSGILGVAVVSAILFLGLAYGPASQITPGGNNILNPGASDLDFAGDPEVEFFFDDYDGKWYANVSVSVQNDGLPRDINSLMILVQSRVADRGWRANSIFLESEIQPHEYWNITTQIRAHDIDDTSFMIYIYEDKHSNGDFRKVGDPYYIPSEKDLYIYSVEIESYEEMLFDEKANVTITVFNEGISRSKGDLYVEVWYNYLTISDYDGAENTYTIHSIDNWEETLSVNVLEWDGITEPKFTVKLYYKGNLIDDSTIYGYD